ncbi:hypothetical protein Syun_009213 [Stephania yunnanensis]|uniref:non-specific serine/threonine protein kinase n=1 Tax=Stephania yunnanensis TaxID=152371 RepID=A0AAP0KFY5_9MAGN
MKVVDREALAFRNKLQRAEMEKEILGMLDHPFLPTLYADFDASHYSCFVMEFCPGGDLHSLRLKQPSRRFNVSSAKFYAAETLVALEYLHMMGIVYRDLKPENVLVREDGHIMLSDFDPLLLELECWQSDQVLSNSTPTFPLSRFDSAATRSVHRFFFAFAVYQEEREQLERNIRNRDAAATKKRCHNGLLASVTDDLDPSHQRSKPSSGGRLTDKSKAFRLKSNMRFIKYYGKRILNQEPLNIELSSIKELDKGQAGSRPKKPYSNLYKQKLIRKFLRRLNFAYAR